MRSNTRPKPTHNFRRPCRRCDELFRPETKYHRICLDCSTGRLRSYWKKKRELYKNDTK